MKKAVMYGARNIGRGFIGQLFSESNYEVAFTDVNTEILSKLNLERKYPVVILTGKDSREVMVESVRSVDGMNLEAVSDEIAKANIMATAVDVNVLPSIVKQMARGLIKRWSNGNFTPLNIIICENLLDANHYLEKLLKMELNEE